MKKRLESICGMKHSAAALIFFLIFALIFSRYCYYGFEYFFQLDDYIQHHNYTARGLSIFEIIKTYGMLAARPLANVADVVFWKNFYPVMILGLALISAMYAASALMLRWVWKRHFGTGFIFLVIYALLPLGLEGTYWMSAATRVVVGLFFASSALVFFEIWCSGGGRRFAALFAAFQLVAFGFYEQALVLSIALTFLLGIMHFKKAKKRVGLALFSFVNAGAYFAFTGAFSATSALYSTRASVVLPGSGGYFTDFFPEVVGQIGAVFLRGGYYTLFKGFERGLQIIFSDVNLIFILVILALCALLFCAALRSEREKPRTWQALAVGAVLALAPLAPFFVLSPVWFSMRGAVTSFCGIALFADALFRMLLSRMEWERGLTAAVAAGLALVFCVSAVSEVHDYRQTTLNDQSLLEELETALTRDGYVDRNLKIAILNVEATYLEEQNFFYHEHIHGITQSDWALTGGLEARLGTSRPAVTPIPASPMYVQWNRSAMLLENFDILYLYKNGKIFEVVAAEEDEHGQVFLFAKDTGEQQGYVAELKTNSAYLVLP